MIYIDHENVTEQGFITLLENTKSNITKKFVKDGIPKILNGVEFENFVFKEMLNVSKKTSFDGHVEQTGVLSFPDIIARKIFGVEVKMTLGDKWVSTGNSILENTRVDSVEKIYMFFGKFGKTFDIKYRKYQECLSDVGVTHSPRYKIDMTLDIGKSIFDKIGVDYDKFRNEKYPIKRLKEYYKNQLKRGEELWWLDANDLPVSPVIKQYRLLDTESKNNFICECMVLFPEIFGNSSTKFDRCASYLIKNYNCVSPSLRDSFTAGGKQILKLNGKAVSVPRIIFNLHTMAEKIDNLLQNIPLQKLTDYWEIEINKPIFIHWLELLGEYSKPAVDVVNNYLAKKQS